MTCCILEKTITTTVIPGNPAVPAQPGHPGSPAYCALEPVQSCAWRQNPNVTYVNGVPTWNGVPLYNTSIQLSVWTCGTYYEVVCYPGVPKTPGHPGIPAVESQVITALNLGWNSHSRGLEPLNTDSVMTFTVKSGVRGVFVALAGPGVGGQPLRDFTHGIMVDASGVWVFERGVQVYQLAATYTSLTVLQIERGFDGVITYRADEEEFESATLAAPGLLYPYAYMYSGGDRIMCASYADISGAGILLSVSAVLPGLRSVGYESGVDLVMVDSTLGALSCETECLEDEALHVSTSLPGLAWSVYEAGIDTIYVLSALPVPTMSAAEADYVPPPLTEIYGNLPIIACSAFCLTVELCDVESVLPILEVACGEGDYIHVFESLAPLGSFATEASRLDMSVLSGAVLTDPSTMLRDTASAMMSSGALDSVYVTQTILAQDLMSALEAESVYQALAEMGLQLYSNLYAQSVDVQAFNTGPAMSGYGSTWAVNLDTAAAGQYDGYQFNSFFRRENDGRWYGLADDGVYLLEGDDDEGRAIDALVDLGSTTFGSSLHKFVPNVYLGVASDGRMLVKAVADGREFVYEARSNSAELATHRVDVGRGLKGNNWSFTILNNTGCDFDLSAVEFLPLVTKRRI